MLCVKNKHKKNYTLFNLPAFNVDEIIHYVHFTLSIFLFFFVIINVRWFLYMKQQKSIKKLQQKKNLDGKTLTLNGFLVYYSMYQLNWWYYVIQLTFYQFGNNNVGLEKFNFLLLLLVIRQCIIINWKI